MKYPIIDAMITDIQQNNEK